MPVFYKLYQENNPKSVNVGKWYAKAKCLGYWDLEKIADHIQDNVSAKKSDVIAVLKELVVVMGEAFSAGYGVKLDGFGSFKVGLKTKAAESAKEFTATKHIVGSRVNFQPETHWSAADGNRRQKPGYDYDRTLENAAKAVAHDEELAKIRARLGWSPRWTVEDALRATIEWTKACLHGEDAAAVTDRQIIGYGE